MPTVIDENFNKTQHMRNGYQQDRQMMTGGNYSGIESVLIQGAVVTETMDYSGHLRPHPRAPGHERRRHHRRA
ncbi:MAG: hypothetical protein O2884_12640 [Chloroflexi bacterium]|nr:hypothetical protein [Chloroflexota bacterium]